MSTLGTIDFLVTHSGGFHADELLSSVILTHLFPNAQLVRTRDPEWITPTSGRVVYDVGRDYDADAGIFDHHQKNVPLRSDGAPYSSFGLIWKHYGRDYLRSLDVPEAHLDVLHQEFDCDFVLPIDLMDNGQLTPSDSELSQLTLPALIESLKPVYDDDRPDAEDFTFKQALHIARAFVNARLMRKASRMRAEAEVVDAIEAAGDSCVLELPRGMPFRAAIEKTNADHLLFVIHPRDTDWMITGIRLKEDGFKLRADLPKDWAGLTDASLEAASGVPGAVFCHNARFIAVAKTRDAIVEMAERAVVVAQSVSSTVGVACFLSVFT